MADFKYRTFKNDVSFPSEKEGEGSLLVSLFCSLVFHVFVVVVISAGLYFKNSVQGAKPQQDMQAQAVPIMVMIVQEEMAAIETAADYVDEQEVEEYIEELDVDEFEYIALASVDEPIKIERPRSKKAAPKREPIRETVLKKVDKPQNDTVKTNKPVSTLGRTQSIYAGNQGNRKVQYRDKVRAALAAHSIYPRSARRRKIAGVGAIEIKIDAKGNVLAHRFIKSTGYHILDQAAIRMIEKATPLPRPLEYNIATPFWISIPIEFKFK